MAELEDSTFERDLSPVARLLAAHDLPSPSEVFLKTLSSEVNHEDVERMKDAQEHMLQRFEKTNEMLLNFNSLSAGRYQTTAQEFKRHTQLLAEMKKDLNNVFRRIRNLKTQLSNQFPESFSATQLQQAATLAEEDEEDDPEGGATGPAAAPPAEIITHRPPAAPSVRPSHARNWERAAKAEAREAKLLVEQAAQQAQLEGEGGGSGGLGEVGKGVGETVHGADVGGDGSGSDVS